MQMDNFQFRKANLLDLPFIFNLLIDGSIEGYFTERFLTNAGTFDIFTFLFLRLLPVINRFGKFNRYKILVFTKKQTDLGFVIINSVGNIQVIEFCAIEHEHRGQKNGTLMIKLFIESVSKNTEIAVYCTKFARPMQHILKKLGFSRMKSFVGNQLELYIFKKEAEPMPSAPISNCQYII